MGTLSAIFCRREVLFVFIGLAVSAPTASAQVNVAEEFQKCVTSCISEEGYTLKNGNYPKCDQCNVFVQCTNSYLYIQECPLGTNYFNRKLGVCDKNMSVCVNDSLVTKSTPPTLSSSTSGPVITTQVLNTTTVIITTTTPTPGTTTSTSQTLQATTSTSVMQKSSSQETTSATNPTSPTTTASTTTTETSVTQTTSTPLTTTTSPTTSTSVIQTSSSQGTTTITSPTVPTTLTPVTTVYIPKPGGEADSFWFAMNLYNNHSLDTVRVGALTVDSVSAENHNDLTFPPGTDYRIYGVTLIRTVCANKPALTKASPTECPLMSTVSGKANRYFVAKCHFKVRYSSPNTAAAKLNMMYMMCDK